MRSGRLAKCLLILLVLLLVVGAIGFLFLRLTKSGRGDNSFLSPENRAILGVPVKYDEFSDEENAAKILDTISADDIPKEDREILSSYFSDNVLTNYPSDAELGAILRKYQDVLDKFIEATNRKHYRYSLEEDYSSGVVLSAITRLAILNSYSLHQKGEIDQSKNYVLRVVKLGKMMVDSSDRYNLLLLGLSIQHTGYSMILDHFNDVISFSDIEKEKLVNELREQHKNLLRIEYARNIEFLDYLDDPKLHPLQVNEEDMELVNSFREIEESGAKWSLEKVNNMLAQSYILALNDIDLDCSRESVKSDPEFDFNKKSGKSASQIIEEFLYNSLYLPMDNINSKRCEVENLINSL